MDFDLDPETSTGLDHYCSLCKRNFANQSNFIKHRRQVHKLHEKVITEYSYESQLFKCEECRTSFKRNEYLKLHLSSEHNLDVNNYEDLSFRSYAEFLDWLAFEEKVSNVEYRQMTGKKRNTTDDTVTIYLQCARSGQVRLISSDRKRALKSQGSKKLGRYCTSQILVRITKDRKCEVKYYNTHYGHEIDVEHLNSPKRGKVPIALRVPVQFGENIPKKVKRIKHIEDDAELTIEMSNSDVCESSTITREEIVDEINRNLLQSISNIVNDVHSEEHLRHILEKSKQIKLLTKIETTSSKSIYIDMRSQAGRKNIQNQINLLQKRKPSGDDEKSNKEEQGVIQETLSIEIVSDSDSDNHADC